MLGRLYEGQECTAARTLEVVGERWSLLILRDALFRGYTHFSDFQRSLGIAANILARRLEVLVAAGIMKAVQTSSHPNHREYVLTEKGQDFKPVVVALTAWGDKWLGDGISPLTLRSKSTGQKFSVALVDERGKRAKGSDIEMVIDSRFERKRCR